MSSFKSSENIQKKERGPDRSVSDNQSSSMTLNGLAMKARKAYCNFKIIIWKAQGVPQLNNVAHTKHPEEEGTFPNINHIIAGKQQQTN